MLVRDHDSEPLSEQQLYPDLVRNGLSAALQVELDRLGVDVEASSSIRSRSGAA